MVDYIINILSYLISCMIGTIVLYDFMEKMYGSKYYNNTIKLIVYIFGGLLWFVVNYFILNPILNLTYYIFFVYFIGFVFYGTNKLGEILQILSFVISCAGCDIIISSVLSAIIGFVPILSNNSLIFLLNVITVEMFIIVISNFLIIYFKKHIITYKYKKQYIFLAIIPIFNAIILYIILILAEYKVDQNFTHIIMSLMAIISSVLNLAVLYFFENISRSNQLEIDNDLMRQQLDMQYSYYQQLEIEYNNSQKIMHDIKNHFGVFEQLYITGHAKEGEKYVEEIYKVIGALAMEFKSNNRILNIIVNEKIKICNDGNIDFTYSVENIDLNFINDVDITSIFANLLDNAIESCNRIIDGTKRIELRVYQFNKMIIINLINSFDKAPVQNGGKLISSKKNHKAIGLSNVKASVEKYDGDLNIEIEQDKFSVSIMFPIREAVRERVS